MQIIINILIYFSIILAISLSIQIIYSSCKFFHLAHASIITLSAYFTYFLFKQSNFSPIVSILFSVLFSISVGVLIYFYIYRPLLSLNINSFSMLIASLGIYIIIQNIISLVWGDGNKNIRIDDVKIGNEFLNAYITNIQILTIVISLSLFLLCLLFLKFTKIGRNIRAISANPELAKILGINTDRIINWAFGIGSGLAAIVGILVASDTGLTPTMGFNMLLYGVVAMIIGGIDSTWGLIGGSVLIALAQHLGAYYIDSKWMEAITFFILILFIIWRPLGFSGKPIKKIEI